MTPASHDQLSRHLLRELSSLNFRFIQLVVESHRPSSRFGLSNKVHERMCRLNDDDKRRLASCPYSLFELKLNDPSAWRQWFASDQQPVKQATHPDQFALAVLMYTQQLAVENADLGRLLLGLAPRVAEQFRRASIGKLMDHAPHISNQLRVRLIDDPNFWPDLVNYVQDGTTEQYVAAQTSALQILAAQL